MLELCEDILVHVFCSSLQFPELTEAMKIWDAVVPIWTDEENDDARKWGLVIGEEKTSKIDLRENCKFPHSPRQSFHDENMMEHSVLIWRLGRDPEALLNTFRYYTAPVYDFGMPICHRPGFYHPNNVNRRNKVWQERSHNWFWWVSDGFSVREDSCGDALVLFQISIAWKNGSWS